MRLISEADLTAGNKFICVRDDDNDNNLSWDMKTVVLTRVGTENLLFSVRDNLGRWVDDGTLTLEQASGKKPYCKLTNSQTGDIDEIFLYLVPTNTISEEDHFMASLQGDYRHVVASDEALWQ